MNQQCPKCYSELEVREATPCFVCGCWHKGEDVKSELEKDDFKVYGLIDDTEIILCGSCHLDEVLAFQGDLLAELNIRQEEAQAEIRFLDFADAELGKDKYCSQCNKRWLLLKVINRLAKSS